MQINKQALQEIIPDSERLLFEENIPAEYLSDALGRRTGTADALVFALSTEEVSGVLRYANENGIPVTPRGAGTNLVGSTIPLFGGIILDVSRMNRVLELDRDTMTVTVVSGLGRRRSRHLVMTASVPSEPMSRCLSDSPLASFTCLPPTCSTVPSARTTSSPRT